MSMLSDVADSVTASWRSVGDSVGWSDCEVNTADVAKGAAAGLIGGLVATLVLDGVQRVMSEPERRKQLANRNGCDSSRTNRQQRRHSAGANYSQHSSPRGEEEDQPPERLATIVAEKAMHKRLNAQQRAMGGSAVHLGFGTFVGALYGALAEVAPVVAIGAGTGYGTAVWALADETALPLFGLDKGPLQRPLSKHVTGFVGHLVYGSVLELMRRGIRTLL